VLQAEPLPNVLEPAAHGQRRRSQHGALQLRPQALAQDRTDIDRRRLEKNILSSTIRALAACSRTAARSPTSPPPLNPKHRVAILRFHREPKLDLNLLRPANEVEYFFGLLWQAFEFARQPRQRLI